MIIYREDAKSKLEKHEPFNKQIDDENNESLEKRKTKNVQMEGLLLYSLKSPNFCEKDLIKDIQGTRGRQCNITSNKSGACSSLCCGRGFNLIKKESNNRCKCKFHWCCHVECQTCYSTEWISICN